MSFDSEFDYAAASAAMDTKVTEQNAAIAALDAQIAAVQALPAAYDTEKTAREAALNSQKSTETLVRDNAQSVKDEITAVTGLSSGDKASLYAFWQLTGESKRSWMQRMLYNHSGSLVADAAAVVADTDLDTQAKQQLAGELTCGKHPLHRNSYMIFRQLPQ